MSSKNTMTEHVTLSAASKLLGVTVRSLRKWSDEGKLRTIRTEGGHRRVAMSEIERLQGFERNPTNTLDNDTSGVYSVCMKRVNYHLTERQLDALRQKSEKSGLSVAELIRRAVDAFLETRGEKV
jgi:putative resolvase